MKYNFSNMLILRFTLSLITLLFVNGKVHSRKHNRGGYRDECPCGVSDFVEQRIINGEIVEDYTKYPWIVGLILSKSNPPWGSCGGVLISPTFVLTAAHCVPARGKEKVLIGLLGKNKKKPAKTVRAKRFIVHPDTGIDLALIELENSVPCTRYNKPICVDPRQNIATVDKIMTIAGFGVITVSNRTEVLREGTSRIVDFRKCPPDYSESMHICGKANGRTRVCFGDSGSSGFLQHKNRFYTVAVVSYGDTQCAQHDISLFVRTDANLSFIRKHVKDLPKQPR